MVEKWTVLLQWVYSIYFYIFEEDNQLNGLNLTLLLSLGILLCNKLIIYWFVEITCPAWLRYHNDNKPSGLKNSVVVNFKE